MVYVVYGAIGTLAVIAVAALGVLAGWKANNAWREHTKRAVASEATEEERRQMIEQQKAFEGMLNYNVDQAYGLVKPLEEYAKDGAE